MKKTIFERAIEQLDSEIAILQLAKAKLQQQQKPPRARPRAVEKPKAVAEG